MFEVLRLIGVYTTGVKLVNKEEALEEFEGKRKGVTIPWRGFYMKDN